MTSPHSSHGLALSVSQTCGRMSHWTHTGHIPVHYDFSSFLIWSGCASKPNLWEDVPLDSHWPHPCPLWLLLIPHMAWLCQSAKLVGGCPIGLTLATSLSIMTSPHSSYGLAVPVSQTCGRMSHWTHTGHIPVHYDFSSFLIWSGCASKPNLWEDVPLDSHWPHPCPLWLLLIPHMARLCQ